MTGIHEKKNEILKLEIFCDYLAPLELIIGVKIKFSSGKMYSIPQKIKRNLEILFHF